MDNFLVKSKRFVHMNNSKSKQVSSKTFDLTKTSQVKKNLFKMLLFVMFSKYYSRGPSAQAYGLGCLFELVQTAVIWGGAVGSKIYKIVLTDVSKSKFRQHKAGLVYPFLLYSVLPI